MISMSRHYTRLSLSVRLELGLGLVLDTSTLTDTQPPLMNSLQSLDHPITHKPKDRWKNRLFNWTIFTNDDT